MRIGILNNLRAGRSDGQVHRLLRYLRDYPEIAHVETDSAGAVPEALAELSRQDVSLLVVNGGDGTLQHALTEILEHQAFDGRIPMISMLPGGRTNMTAQDIGTKRDPVRQLDQLIHVVKRGELNNRISERRVMRVAHGPSGEVRCGMFFGAGVIHRAIDFIHARMPQGRGRGSLGSTLVTGTLITQLGFGKGNGILSPDKAQVMIDGELLEMGEFRLLMASTVNRLFAGMRPFWGEGEGGIRMTAIAPDAPNFLRCVPSILRGRPHATVTPENGYLSLNAKRLDIRLDAGFTVDGEQVSPESGQAVSITADHVVRFVPGL